jgi:hypothetical protein
MAIPVAGGKISGEQGFRVQHGGEVRMREVILSYWNSVFADFIRPYRDDITAISTLIVAIFTVVLARVAWKQIRDARILQRAYLDVGFGGIRDSTAGELVGHVDFKNVGHLPAQKLHWLVRLDSGDSHWRSPKIRNKYLTGESVIPVGAKWPKGSNGLPHPADAGGVYLYVWGRATYADGFRWRKRRVDFCHRYPWKMRTQNGGGVSISAEYARYHEYGNNAT